MFPARHKRVTVLQLKSQGLEGSLSPHVGNLSFLRELSLTNNSFQGTIPHELGRLSRLRRLFLSENNFSGVIPTNLSGQQVNRWNPTFLGEFTSEHFSARGNPLGGLIPDTLGHWKSLTGFGVGGCNLYGSIPHSIFNLSLLVNLSLAGNHLTGSLPSEIDISSIRLRNNNFHGRGEADDMRFIGSLRNCTRLVRLNLRDCNLIGVLPISIGLSYNSLSGSIPSEIRDLKLLSEIDLSYNNLSGNITSSLGILDSDDDRFVAIKVLHLQNRGAHKSFLAECEAWRNIRHRNLLKIITSCSSVDFQGNDFKALVYEFMPNGKYGIGSDMTSSGDVYSFGISLLEVMTGKKPTDDTFNDGFSLHKFAYMSLPDHAVDLIDGDAIVLQSTEANAKKVEECLVATIKIGVCALGLSSSLYGEVESNCNKE
ncbi:kinase-like domain-containing protein [Tanacetum coccineum]